MSDVLYFSCDDNGIVMQWGIAFTSGDFSVPLSSAPQDYNLEFPKKKWIYDGSSFIERDGWIEEYQNSLNEYELALIRNKEELEKMNALVQSSQTQEDIPNE